MILDFFFCHFYVVSISAFTQGWFTDTGINQKCRANDWSQQIDSVCLWSVVHEQLKKKKVCQQSVPDLPQLTMTHWMGCVLWPILDYWTSNLTSVEWKALLTTILHRSICCLNPLERDILSTFWSFYPGGPEAKSRIITLDSCFSAYVFVGVVVIVLIWLGRGEESGLGVGRSSWWI